MPWFPTCGGVDTSDANVTPEDVLEGKIVYSHNGPVVGTIPSLPEKTWIPGPEEQVIPGGHYITGTQTIKGDPNLYPENIVKGKTIFGVEGTGIPVEFNDPKFIEKLCISDYLGGVSFSRDSEYFYTYGSSVINKHNSTTGEILWTKSITENNEQPYSDLYITPDDANIYYGSKNGYFVGISAATGEKFTSLHVFNTTKAIVQVKGIENYKGSLLSLFLFVTNTTVIGRLYYNDSYTAHSGVEEITIPSSFSIDVDDTDLYYYCNSSSPKKICKVCVDSADNYEIKLAKNLNDYGIQPDGKYLYTISKVDNTNDTLSKYDAATGALIGSINIEVPLRDNNKYLIADSLSEYIYLNNMRSVSRYSSDLSLNYINTPFLSSDSTHTVLTNINSVAIDSNGEYVYVEYMSGSTDNLYKYKQVFGSIYPLENPDPYINIDRIIKRKKDTYKTFDTPVEIWNDEYASEVKSISCTDDGHYVYICTTNGGFTKLNSINKKVLWTYNDNTLSGYVVVDHNDQYVYVASNAALTKLDASNGSVVTSLTNYARSRSDAYSIQNMSITKDNQYLVYINNNSSTPSSSKIVKFKTSDMSVSWEKSPHSNYINQLDLVSKTGEIYFNKSSQIPIESEYILPFTGGVNNVVRFNDKYLVLPNKTFITNSETNTVEFTYYLGDTPNIAHMDKHIISTDGMNTNFSNYTITKIVASSYMCILYVKGIDNASLTESETSLNKYYYTYDGINWSEGSFGLHCPTSNIISCSNTFVYSASDKSTYNKLFSSYDGITWTENTNYTDTYANGTVWGLAYNGSIYILVSNILQYSPNFKSFYTATIDSLPSETGVGSDFPNRYGEVQLVYSNYSTYFLACTGGIYKSSDCKMWTLCNFTYPTTAEFPSKLSYPLHMDYYNRYIYIIESAVGNTAEISNYIRSFSVNSSSQTSFSLTNIKAAPLLYESSPSIWVAGAANDVRNGLYYSTNGKSWTKSNITNGGFESLYYANDIWVAGVSSVTGNDANKGLYYSTDGKVWTQSNVISATFASLYYANGIWVAGAHDFGIYYSTDGKLWTKSNITGGTFYTVYYANGIWVAGSGYRDGLYYSTDGKVWTRSNITGGNFYTVYYANGIWVATGGGNGIYYSIDGKVWSQSNIAEGWYRSAYYANGIWVVCTDSGNEGLYYSTDGKVWNHSNITGGTFYTVYYANGIWVASSNENKGLYYSTDGKVWTQSNTYLGNFRSVYYANDIFVATNVGDGNCLYYSTDGKVWNQSNLTSGSFESVYNSSTIVFYPNNYIDSNNKLLSYPAVTADDTHTNTKYSIGSYSTASAYIQQLTYQDTRTPNTTNYASSVMGGSTAILLGDSGDNYAYSTDSGATWIGARMPKKGKWIYVGKLMNKYIAIYNNINNLLIYESSDGKSWTEGSVTDSNGNALPNNGISINNDENETKIKVLSNPKILTFAIIMYTTIGVNVEGYYVSSSLNVGSAYKVTNYSSNMTSTPLCVIQDTSQNCMYLGWSNDGKFMYSNDSMLSLMNGNYYTKVTPSESVSNWDIYSEITGVKLSDTQYLVSIKEDSSDSTKIGLLDTSANTLTFRSKTTFNGRFVAPANGKLYLLNTYSVNGTSGGGKFITMTNYDSSNTVKDDNLPTDLTLLTSSNKKSYVTLCSSDTNLITVVDGEPYAYYTKNPLVISGGDDKYIKATDFMSGGLIWSYSISNAVNGIYTSDDNKFIYAIVNGNSSSARLYKFNINKNGLDQIKNDITTYVSALFGNGDKIFIVKNSNGNVLDAYDPTYLTESYLLTGANDTSTEVECGRCLAYDSAGDYIYAGTYMNTGKGHLHKYKLKEIEYEKIARVYKTTTTDSGSTTPTTES